MSLEVRLAALVARQGAVVKALTGRVTSLEQNTSTPVLVLAQGAEIPVGTPPNTLIVWRAA